MWSLFCTFANSNFVDFADEQVPKPEVEPNAASSSNDTSTVFVKEETPDTDQKDDKFAIKVNTPTEQPEVKDEPPEQDEVLETKRAPAKDPLAEAMSEVMLSREGVDTRKLAPALFNSLVPENEVCAIKNRTG